MPGERREDRRATTPVQQVAMAWAVEQPLVILFIGAMCLALAAAVWVQTRDQKALLALVAVVLSTTLWVLAERLIVTEVEQVTQTIHRMAADLESNDVDRVLNHVAASNAELRTTIRAALSVVSVQSISIKRNLKATVLHRGGRTAAEARFNAVAVVTDRAGRAGRRTVPRFVIVRMRKEDGRWLVHDYELHDPRGEDRGRQRFGLPR